MRPPVSRAVRWAGALVLAVIVAVAVFSSGGSRPNETRPVTPDVAQTEFGPLAPSDVDLLVKVRQAGLWEIPTGQQMQQRASRAVVADVGRRLATEHTELDAIVRQTADQLGVTLPSQPSSQQQTWMEQITAASGPDYDRTAVNLLRLAHGNVLPVIAQVRSGTRNDLVREFATTAATFVTRHHEYLESTGMVDFAALPAPPGTSAPPSSPAPAADSSATPADAGAFGAVIAAIRDASLSSYLAAVVAFAAVIGAGTLLDMVVRGRSRPAPAGPAAGHPARRYPAPPPFPGPPPPPRPRPRSPHPRSRAPGRAAGPVAFSILLVAVLVLPPILTRTTTATPPESPSRSTAVAAGFAALDPAPDHVLALAAVSRDDGDGGDSADNRDNGNSGADANGQDGAGNNNAGNERGSGGNSNSDDGNGNGNGNGSDNGSDNNNNNDDNSNGNNDNGNNDAEQFPGREDAAPPGRDDFTDIGDVTDVLAEPVVRAVASTGSYVAQCGTPEPDLRNSDNWIVAPGKVNGAQHMHDYVGSVATDAFTSGGDLLESTTTCPFDDRSTFFWPVLRDTTGVGPDANEDGGGLDGNEGEILQPANVVLQFLGSATGSVEPMPQLLRVITGDAKAVTNGDENVRAQWTCRGFEDRAGTQYPLCPTGSRLLRVLDFPSCWDGERLDSEDHRSHIVFPDEQTGACQNDTVAVPQLRMILAYDQPPGRTFALDSFPEQQHNPATDHGDFVNGMSPGLMAEVVECINEGLQC